VFQQHAVVTQSITNAVLDDLHSPYYGYARYIYMQNEIRILQLWLDEKAGQVTQ
jgi:hypothetical protein